MTPARRKPCKRESACWHRCCAGTSAGAMPVPVGTTPAPLYVGTATGSCAPALSTLLPVPALGRQCLYWYCCCVCTPPPLVTRTGTSAPAVPTPAPVPGSYPCQYQFQYHILLIPQWYWYQCPCCTYAAVPLPTLHWYWYQCATDPMLLPILVSSPSCPHHAVTTMVPVQYQYWCPCCAKNGTTKSTSTGAPVMPTMVPLQILVFLLYLQLYQYK